MKDWDKIIQFKGKSKLLIKPSEDIIKELDRIIDAVSTIESNNFNCYEEWLCYYQQIKVMLKEKLKRVEIR